MHHPWEGYVEAWRARQEAAERAAEEQRARAWRGAAAAARVLMHDYGAARVWVVGSLSRGTFQPGSDIDLMVEGIGESAVTHAQHEAARAAGCSVDILRAEDLSPGWRLHHARFGRELPR